MTLDEATQVLSKSHMENPLWKHIFPLLSDKDLFEALQAVFEILGLTAFEYGYAISLKDSAQMNSVALLIPPGAQIMNCVYPSTCISVVSGLQFSRSGWPPLRVFSVPPLQVPASATSTSW